MCHLAQAAPSLSTYFEVLTIVIASPAAIGGAHFPQLAPEKIVKLNDSVRASIEGWSDGRPVREEWFVVRNPLARTAERLAGNLAQAGSRSLWILPLVDRALQL